MEVFPIMANESAEHPLSLSMESTVVAAEAAISTDLDGEVVILETNKGIYYGLDAVGACIWNQLHQRTTLANIRDAVLQEYDVDLATCERDLITLIQSLSSNSLVIINESGRP